MSALEASDTKSGYTCGFCSEQVAGPRYQAHVEGCSLPHFDPPRSPIFKDRLHKNIFKCRGKFKSLGQPIREELVGSLKRLAWNSNKMCPAELSSMPKRPLSLHQQDLDEKMISMIFTSKEEQISKDRSSLLKRSKKRKPAPDFTSSPLQESQFEKRQRSPNSPLGNLTPAASSPSLPSLPGTPATPITPGESLPPISPLSSDDFPSFGLGEIDEPEFDMSQLPSLSFDHSDTLSSVAHYSPGKIGQSLESTSSPPLDGGGSQFVFSAPPPDPMTTSHKQAQLKEQLLVGQEDSTLNIDSAPSFPHHYSPSEPERERKEKAEKLRYFIMQHQQLLLKAEQVFSSLPGEKSSVDLPSWTSSGTPETDVSLLTQSLDQIARFTSQRLAQIARAAKIQEMYSQPALSSMFTTPNSFPMGSTPYQSPAQLAREREFLIHAAVKGRADLLKRPLSQNPQWKNFLDHVLEPTMSLV